jgi:hypothetical protein
MIYFVALIPATALTIAGYFALYLSNRSEGGLRTFGKYLGFWAFILAGLVILGSIFAAAHAGRHCGMMGARGMHGRMHGPWHGDSRFFGPHRGERGDADSHGDGAHGPPPQSPDDAGASAPAPAPGSSPPH